MKKQVKMVLALLTTIMAVSLSACGSPSKGADLETALKNAQDLKAYDADFEMTAAVTVDEEMQEIDMSGKMKVSGTTAEDMIMSADMTMGLLGMSVDLTYYYKDGYIYMDLMGEQMKAAVDFEKALGSIGSVPDLYQDGGIGIFGDVTSSKADDNTVYSYTVPEDKLSEIVDAFSTNTLTSSVGVGGDYTISNVAGTITVDKDNNVIEQTMDMSMDYSGTAMDMSMKLKMNETGDKVEVTLPEDLEGYEEVDASTLGY